MMTAKYDDNNIHASFRKDFATKINISQKLNIFSTEYCADYALINFAIHIVHMTCQCEAIHLVCCMSH